MAAPNVVNVATITAKTAVQTVGTSYAAVVSNSSASGKVFKVNTLLVSNVDGSATADISASLYRSATHYRLISTAPIPPGSTLSILPSSIYLEEGDDLQLSASVAGDLEAVVSYEEISE